MLDVLHNLLTFQVYCDADTGYYGIQNVRKTVQDFISAGVMESLKIKSNQRKQEGRLGIQSFLMKKQSGV